MIDQIIIGDKSSFDDFGASLARRNIQMPKKKSIKETVPFSNITYDFSAINGELYWEERTLEYVLEMIAPDPEKLEEMKAAFSGWVMNTFEEKLIDPFYPDYHYLVTYDDMSYEDEEGLEKTTVTVKFTAYPYRISNMQTIYNVDCSEEEALVRIVNNSSHKVIPTITADGAFSVNTDKGVASLGKGVWKSAIFELDVGVNNFIFRVLGASKITLGFNEEVF